MPDWVDLKRENSKVLELTAAPLRSSGRKTRPYHLIVRDVGGQLQVREDGSQSRLPRHCPQRHLNDDGSFCLGLRAGEKIWDPIAAHRWWQQLQVFLTCQETAHETGA